MRKLMWFTLGFGGACGLSAAIVSARWYSAAALAMFTLGAVGCLIGKDRRWLLRGAFVLLGLGAGLWWYALFQSGCLQNAALFDGQTRPAVIRTTDYSRLSNYGSTVDGIVTLGGKQYQIRAYLDETKEIPPGMELTGAFRFRLTTPDGAEESAYHPGKGIFLLAYQTDAISVTESTEDRWRSYPAILRRQIRDILNAAFPSDTAFFARALLLGDSTGLDYATDTALKLSGIRHVIAVSGLHVSILFALITAVTFRKRLLTALLGFPALVLFAAVAGFTPSVTRACIMSGLMLLALFLDRQYDSATALAFACLVMLSANPLVITSISFQLSVASVAGICLFAPSLRSRLTLWLKGMSFRTGVTRWIVGSVSVTLSAMVLTTPLCAVHFGTVSLISVVTNLLTLWVISIVFYGIVAVCLLSVVWAAGASLLAKVISVPIRYILFAANIMAQLPFAAVYTRSVYIVLWLVLVYVLLLILLCSEKKNAGTAFCCGVLGLCAAMLLSWAEPMTDGVRLTVLDVGQGQCLLLQSDGKTYLVDCGGDSDTRTADIAAETLLSQGISRLDGIILTHCDRDHAGGVANLLSRVDTDLLILPPVATDLAQYTDGEVVYAEQDITIRFGDTQIRIYAAKFPGNSNENSLCILFDTKNCDILITGDRNAFGERMLLRGAQLPDVDVLIAGHHGSKNSTCEELLCAVRPEIVCISVGADNSYGHPVPEMLQRLQRYGCTVYRTDINGTILIRR